MRTNVLNIETPMTAILYGDNPLAATIWYPHDVTTSLHILHVNDGKANTYTQTCAKSKPARRSWPAGTYTNLNSHCELSGRPFFHLKIMDGSGFQKK